MKNIQGKPNRSNCRLRKYLGIHFLLKKGQVKKHTKNKFNQKLKHQATITFFQVQPNIVYDELSTSPHLSGHVQSSVTAGRKSAGSSAGKSSRSFPPISSVARVKRNSFGPPPKIIPIRSNALQRISKVSKINCPTFYWRKKNTKTYFRFEPKSK